MTLAGPPDQLVDPLAAFYAQDPSVLSEAAPPPPPVAIAQRPHDRIAWEIAAAVLVAGTIVRHRLQTMRPEVGQTKEQVQSAWSFFAPTWLRLTVPAIRQAYALGRVDGLTDDELEALASDYARGIGEYFNESSAAALEEGFNAQLAQRWDAGLAWHRAAAAYGVDRRDMKTYLKAAITDKGVDPIPAIARTVVDRAFLARAERLGTEEAYSATQAGQAVSWMYLEKQGRIPLGSTREWEMGENEEHCATCAELALQVVALDQPFVLKSGAKIWAPRAHPGCHCRVRLRPPKVEISKAQISCAGLVVVAKDTGRVLMLQRAKDGRDRNGGMWEFPGGHLEAGESPRAGAIREWQEECRRRIPKGTWRGSWQSGIYEGHVLEIPHETEIETHRRGRVLNPDDPDGDMVEAIAWWDLTHLPRNPAIRQEVRASLRDTRFAIRDSGISKAYDPGEARDRRGRWAEVAEAEPEVRDETPAKPDSPFRPATGNPFRQGANPFAAANPFRSSSPFTTGGQPGNPFRAPASPFGGTRSGPHALIVNHAVVIGLPKQRSEPAAEPYVMAVDDFHMAGHRAALGARYGLSKLVDFNVAERPPIASSEISAWDAIDEDMVIVKSVPAHMGRGELDRHWDAIEKAARVGFNAAFTEAEDDLDPIVAKLREHDLSRIFKLAGYEDEADGTEAASDRMRLRIRRAVRDHGEGSSHVDSLAEAYADYVTFAEPVRLLGRDTGGRIDRAMNEAEAHGLEVRDFHVPVPVEQVFNFEEGFHPHTELVGANRQEAKLVSQYAPYAIEYRSALANYDTGEVPPMRFGLQVLHMMPMTHAPGLGDTWIPLRDAKAAAGPPSEARTPGGSRVT